MTDHPMTDRPMPQDTTGDTRTGKLVLASNNQGKLRELGELLAPLGLQPIAQGELGVGEAEEPACTFVENALLKARHAAQQTGLPALADDSGLAVDALGGQPGVRSARYAGVDASDAENVQALLTALKAVPEAERTAQFHCVLVYLPHAHHLPWPLAGADPGTSERKRRFRLRPGVLRP